MRQCIRVVLVWLLVATPVFAEELFFENFAAGAATTSFELNTADVGGVAGTAGPNYWLINDSYAGGSGSLICLGFPFTFMVAGTEAQPGEISGAPNSPYLHIVSNAAIASGISNATYMPSDGFCIFDSWHFARMSADINTVGRTATALDFWWLCGGSSTASGQVYYSLDSGVSWTLVTVPVTNYSFSSIWQHAVLSLPEWDNQASLRFGFRFRNETASTATDPGFGVDDVRVSATALPDDVFANGFED